VYPSDFIIHPLGNTEHPFVYCINLRRMKLPQYVLEVGVLSRNEYDNYCLTFKKNPLKMSAHSFGEYMKEEMKKKVEKKKEKKRKKTILNKLWW